VRHRRATVGVEEGRQQVDRLDQCGAACAARSVGARVRVVDDQRQPDHLLVEQVLLAHPVIAQVVAMVRGEHEHRRVHQAVLLEVGEQVAERIVALLDQRHLAVKLQ
jgi:NADPH-dependent 2,4-dienoyl-CoA reductase/sulfur reductase-like enzyme